MKVINRTLGVLSIAFGVMCFGEGYRLWKGWEGSGVMPVLVGAVFVFLCVGFFAIPAREDDAIALPGKKEMHVIAVIGGSFAIYIGIIDVVGYVIATWLILAVVTKCTSDARLLTVVVWPGVLSVGSYLLFGMALGTHLPTGILDLGI